MSSIKVAILGFGTVGEGVYKTISTHQDKLTAVLGKKVEVVAVLLRNKYKEREIDKRVLVTDDIEDIFNIKDLDVVVEAIVGCEPANTYLRQAIKKGCHVITANKEMFAHHGTSLKQLAAENGVSVGFEATVAGGVPVIQTIQHLLNINRIQRIEGILNGTSNYILSEMRSNHQTFEAALKEAQEKGYAEADPTNDVEGFDAFYKLMILSEIAFGEKPEWDTVTRKGITTITSKEISEAERLGLRFKLIASIQILEGKVVGSVRPTLVPDSHPLFHIEGVENSVSIEGDIVGRITLQGPGAGMLPTASAVVEDLIHVILGTETRKENVSLRDSIFREDKGKRKQKWLMMNLGKETLKELPLADKIELDEHIIFKADEPMISKLQKQNLDVRFFEVLGEFEINDKSHVSFNMTRV